MNERLKLHRSLRQVARGERCDLSVCRGACCVNGIWVDIQQVQRILDAAAEVAPFMAPQYAQDPDLWFGEDTLQSPDFPSGLAIPTRVGPRDGDATRQGCIFVRADHKCALQMTSVALNLPGHGLKPFDCATYPILRSQGQVRVDRESARHHPEGDCQNGGPTKRIFAEVFAQEVELCLHEPE